MKMLSLLMLFGTVATIPVLTGNKPDEVKEANEKTELLFRPVNLSTDNWTTFAASLNMGKTFFKKTYFNDQEYTDMIGTRRMININGENKAIELIDIEKDINSNNEKALMTWQFVNPFVIKSFGSTNAWYRNNGEIESNVRKFCNEDLYNAMPDAIRDNIAPVLKKTYGYNGYCSEVIYTEEKIFPLSLSEAGYPFLDEGNTYTSHVPMECTSWFRSAKADTTDEVYVIDGEKRGNIEARKVTEEDLYIYPAFALEVKPKDSTVNLFFANCTIKEGNTITGKSGEVKSLTVTRTSSNPLSVISNTAMFDTELVATENKDVFKLNFTMPASEGMITGKMTYRNLEDIDNLTNYFGPPDDQGKFSRKRDYVIDDNSRWLTLEWQFTDLAIAVLINIPYPRAGTATLNFAPGGFYSATSSVWDGYNSNPHVDGNGVGYVDNGWDAGGALGSPLHTHCNNFLSNVSNDANFYERTKAYHIYSDYKYSNQYNGSLRDEYVNEIFHCKFNNKYYKFKKTASEIKKQEMETHDLAKFFDDTFWSLGATPGWCAASRLLKDDCTMCGGYKYYWLDFSLEEVVYE